MKWKKTKCHKVTRQKNIVEPQFHTNKIQVIEEGFAVNKMSICGVAVISNLTVCDVCVFHATVFSEMKLFAAL